MTENYVTLIKISSNCEEIIESKDKNGVFYDVSINI